MKKLSGLQQTILRLGLENSGSGSVDVSPDIVKAVYYGFSVRPKGRCILFSKSDMGGKAIQLTAAVNIARSFDRLAKSGLAVRIYGGGIKLTQKGREMAKKLM